MEERHKPISLAELASRPIEPPAQAPNNGAQPPAAPGPSAMPHQTENRPGPLLGAGRPGGRG
jgi:hypothetical protein